MHKGIRSFANIQPVLCCTYHFNAYMHNACSRPNYKHLQSILSAVQSIVWVSAEYRTDSHQALNKNYRPMASQYWPMWFSLLSQELKLCCIANAVLHNLNHIHRIIVIHLELRIECLRFGYYDSITMILQKCSASLKLHTCRRISKRPFH